MAIKEQTSEGNLFPDMPTTPATVPVSTPKKRGRKPLVREPEPRPDLTKEEMREKLIGIKEIESVTGIRYIRLHVTAKIVKEAFTQSFSDSEMMDYWKNLKKAGLISEKKYNNLQKNNVDDILTKGFINRQLVETRQIVKSVANLILDYYNEQIDVIEVKASLSTSVRKMLTYEKKDNI